MGLAPVRALLVLAVFVVAVVTLVAVGTRPEVSGVAFSAVTTTTVSSHQHQTTTTTTVAKASVSVIVANATNSNGLAAHYSTLLGGDGWQMKTPTDAATTVAQSMVYYAAGQEAAASEIATALGLQAKAVAPLTSVVPVAGVSGVDVVVVVGADLVTAAGT